MTKERLMAAINNSNLQFLKKKEKEYICEDILKRKNPQARFELWQFLFDFNRIFIDEYNSISVANMKDHFRRSNLEVTKQLLDVYRDLNKRKPGYLSEFKRRVAYIVNKREDVDYKIYENLVDTLGRLTSALSVSLLSTDDAQVVFTNLREQSSAFLTKCDNENLEELVTFLKKKLKLTNKEIISLSKKCSTFFIYSSAKKLTAINTALENFRLSVKDRLISFKDKNSLLAIEALDHDFKDKLLNNGAVMIKNARSISDTLKFLTGAPMGEITVSCSKRMKNVKGDFSPLQLAKIYDSSLTSITIDVKKICDVGDNCYTAFKQATGEELNLDGFFNGRNFSALNSLLKDDYDLKTSNKIVGIFTLLSKVLSTEDLEKALKNDLRFLTCSYDEVKKGLKDAILMSSNEAELKANIIIKIRNSFDKYKRDKYVKRTGKTIVANTNLRVNIKKLDDKELVNVLSSLGASEEEINKWNTNYDETNVKKVNPNVLVETINDDILDCEYIINEAFNNYNDDGVIEEVMLIKSILEEIDLKLADIKVSKLTENSKILLENIKISKQNIIDMITEKLTSIETNYLEQLQKFNDALDNNKKDLEISIKREAVHQQWKEQIDTKNITKQKLNYTKNILKKSKTSIKKIHEAKENIDNLRKKLDALGAGKIVNTQAYTDTDTALKECFKKMLIHDVTVSRDKSSELEFLEKMKGDLLTLDNALECKKCFAFIQNNMDTATEQMVNIYKVLGIDPTVTPLSVEEIEDIVNTLDANYIEEQNAYMNYSETAHNELKQKIAQFQEEDERLTDLIEKQINKIELVKKALD